MRYHTVLDLIFLLYEHSLWKPRFSPSGVSQYWAPYYSTHHSVCGGTFQSTSWDKLSAQRESRLSSILLLSVNNCHSRTFILSGAWINLSSLIFQNMHSATCSYLRTLRCFSDLHLVNRSGQLWVMSFFGILNNVLALAILKLCVLVQIHALKIDSDTRYCSSLLWASEHIFSHRNNNAKCLGSCQNVARKQRQFKGV